MLFALWGHLCAATRLRCNLTVGAPHAMLVLRHRCRVIAAPRCEEPAEKHATDCNATEITSILRDMPLYRRPASQRVYRGNCRQIGLRSAALYQEDFCAVFFLKPGIVNLLRKNHC